MGPFVWFVLAFWLGYLIGSLNKELHWKVQADQKCMDIAHGRHFKGHDIWCMSTWVPRVRRRAVDVVLGLSLQPEGQSV